MSIQPGQLTSLSAGDAARRARILKALSDPVRLRIVSLVAGDLRGRTCVCDITPHFELSQPTISHHLKILRDAGLLLCERSGTWVYYWIPQQAAPLLEVLLGPSGDIARSESPDPSCC